MLVSVLAPSRRLPQCLKRTLFTLPDLSSLAGNVTGRGNDTMTYSERKILPFTQKQLFDVVLDMTSYPHFVPYCKHVEIVKPATEPYGDKTMVEEASMTVGFLGFTESYTSRVTSRPYESVEAVALSSTPLFKSLSNTWRFQPTSSTSPHPLSDGIAVPAADAGAKLGTNDPNHGPTLVSLDLAYAFANPMHAAISKAFFGQISRMMVEAFETRCLDVYGPQKL